MPTNEFVNPSWVAMEVLRFLINKLEIAGMFNTGWNEEFRKEFAVGQTVTGKKPARFIHTSGLGYQPSNISRQTVTVTLDRIRGVHFAWDDYEKAIYLERSKAELQKNYLEPAANELYQAIESACAEHAYYNTPNTFGVLGTNPTARTPFANAEARLFDKSGLMGVPGMFVSAGMMNSFLDNQAVQFNPSAEITAQYKRGLVGMHAGSEWYRSPSLYRHTAGTWAGAVTVNLGNQTGSTLNVNCTTGDTFLRGDVISIANVNFVNINTRRVPSGNQVQHYVITAPVTGAASAAALPIFPSIVGPGSPYQNVDALPANLAALTLWPGTTTPSGLSGTIGLLLTKMAFGLVWAKFDQPKAVEEAYQKRDSQTGVNIRFVRWWDGDTSEMRHRFDMAFGFGNLYPDECAARIVGA